ncbi:MAG: hypothetical protein AAFR96_03225 [Planctomycetota bacterium]
MTTPAIVGAALLCAASASSQDLQIDILSTPLPDTYVVAAEYFGSLPAGTTGIGAIWSDTRFSLEGDGSNISFIASNPGYSSAVFGDPTITNGAAAEFFGLLPGAGIGSPDASNPLFVTAFTYSGDINAITLDLVGQNSAAFFGNPLEPFGTIRLYQDTFGNPGSLTWSAIGFPGSGSVSLDQVPWIPTPGTGASLVLAGLVTLRRRR